MPKATAGASDSHWPHFFELGLHLPQRRTGFGANVAKQISGLGLILDLKIYISLKFPAPCQLQISQHMQISD
jgi:hypothetical protein